MERNPNTIAYNINTGEAIPPVGNEADVLLGIISGDGSDLGENCSREDVYELIVESGYETKQAIDERYDYYSQEGICLNYNENRLSCFILAFYGYYPGPKHEYTTLTTYLNAFYEPVCNEPEPVTLRREAEIAMEDSGMTGVQINSMFDRYLPGGNKGCSIYDEDIISTIILSFFRKRNDFEMISGYTLPMMVDHYYLPLCQEPPPPPTKEDLAIEAMLNKGFTISDYNGMKFEYVNRRRVNEDKFYDAVIKCGGSASTQTLFYYCLNQELS